MPISMPVATLASGILSAGSGLFGIGANSLESAANRRFQAEQAQINRDWQSNENKLSRDWQEKMWNAENLYNTPSAMMERYRDANLNPFVLGTNSPVVGQAGSAGNAPSGGSFTPAPVGSQAHYSMPDLGDMMLKASQVSANVANQRAEKVRTLVDGATQAYKIGGKGAFRTFVHTFAPFLITADENNSPYERYVTSVVRENVADAVVKENQGVLIREFGEKQALQGLEESNYRISEMVGRLNTMRITNDIAIKKLANDTIVAAAQAFNLRKVGNYYEASADQVRALKKYIVQSAKANADIDEGRSTLFANELPYKLQNLESGYAREKNENEILGSKYAIFADYLTDQIGDVIHIGFGKNSSSIQGMTPPNSISAEWSQPNPFGGQTRYTQTRYSK